MGTGIGIRTESDFCSDLPHFSVPRGFSLRSPLSFDRGVWLWGFAVAGGEDESQHLAWHAVASWTWDAQDETCGICRMAFDGCCPDCKLPGDDCPLIWGACNHAFHLHCILKWVNSQTSQAHCPMCRREWQFKG
ncbi:LOW QUALITY PROTEIN: anaphase-promoting complex subunit 11 [Pyrus x bretschneideri]|uniref:LOW QUALITY PROTEIN: anaphase-promoting complex subunit 11 n=1 Tax=Pyrus x bretschneideri TaxID=225117 RepID=UPI00202ED8BA|nr:LOW QUALITY PROTEIN: anaphase-promoting complex subunit 11 [Pyrus x bretschneideri]